jgi:integrase
LSAYNPGALDPTDGIDIRLPDSEDPDPFARDEIHQILTTPPRHDRHQEINLIQYMMWSGPRPSEAIALAWEDVVDLDKGLVNIRRGNVNGKFRVTKTRRSKRTVELLKPALEALQAQHELTYKQRPIKIQIKDRDNRTIKEEKLRFIFLNTNTGQPHASDFTLRERFFKHHLKIAGVRYRGPANCRHTFISQMLTAGLPIEWIIQQVGHTTPEMIRRVYGKWLNEDAADWRAVAEARLGL